MSLAQLQAEEFQLEDQERLNYFREISKIPVLTSGLCFNNEFTFNRLSPDLIVKNCPIRQQEGLVEFKSLFSGKEKTSFWEWMHDSSTKNKVLQESKTEAGKICLKKNHPWVHQCECKYHTYHFNV